MKSSDFWVLAAMAVYFIVIITIGFVFAKRSNASSENYFIGGRKLGPWLTAFSAESSDMSGWLLMGVPGLAYFYGASDAMWTAIGIAIGTYLNWKLVAKRLRKYSEVANNSITLPDYFSNRFRDDKKILMTIAALVTLLFFSIYLGSCFVTVGRLFSTLFGFDYAAMMVVGALVVFIYTFVGGYLSVSATDLVQGTLMFVALIVIFVGSIVQAGGLDNAVAFLRDIPGFLSGTQIANPLLDASGHQMSEQGNPLFGDPGEYGIIAIISCLVWGLGYFGMPQVLIRFFSIRHSSEIKQSRIIAMVWVVISLAAAVSIGLIGRAALPVAFTTQATAESIFIVLSQMLLPAFMCGLVVSGIFAASMSSSSAYMIISSSAVAQNIFKGLFKKDASDKQIMMVARIAMIVILFLGVLIAMDENSSIFMVVSYAWAGFGASFGPLMLFSLYWRRTNKWGALAGMITGASAVLIWHELIKPLGGIWGIYEILPAFILASIAIVVVSLLTKPPSEEIQHEFDIYMDADI